VLALTAAPAAHAQPSDWERRQKARDWREREVVLPTVPDRARLLPFYVSATATFRFFVDPASISVGDDGVVRYTLLARSPEGAETVTYEGMRCSERQFRIYAIGEGTGWTRVDKPWRPILLPSMQPWEEVLYREVFCPLGNPVRNDTEAVAALRGANERGPAPDGNYNY